MKKGVIFDLDGTLFDTGEVNYWAYKEALLPFEEILFSLLYIPFRDPIGSVFDLGVGIKKCHAFLRHLGRRRGSNS